MNEQNNNPMHDPAEEALALLDKENKEFNNHWLWKELNCSPDEFFEKMNKHVASLNIPKDEWNRAFEKAKAEHKVKALEKRTRFRPANLNMIGALRV